MQNQFYGFLIAINKIVNSSLLIVQLSWDYLTENY